MKKTWLLAALFLLLGGGAWYALHVKKNQSSTIQSPDMEFAVPNTDDIGKIFIAGRTGKTTATLERKDGYWLYNGQYKARASAMETLLETIQKVNVQSISAQVAEPRMVKSLAAEGIKVEIYDKKGQKMKCYYVGGVTNDEKGTFMIMENSERPYVVHIPSFVGQLRVRYMLGDDLWRDRSIFAEKPEEIQSVTVEYPQRKSDSFRMEKVKDGEYKVLPYFSTTSPNATPQRKGFCEGYLLKFENLQAEAFDSNNSERDSISSLVPFAIIKLKRGNGEEQQARFWPVDVQQKPGSNEWFTERYFVEKNSTDFLVAQHTIFGALFKPYNFFFEGGKQPRIRN